MASPLAWSQSPRSLLMHWWHIHGPPLRNTTVVFPLPYCQSHRNGYITLKLNLCGCLASLLGVYGSPLLFGIWIPFSVQFKCCFPSLRIPKHYHQDITNIGVASAKYALIPTLWCGGWCTVVSLHHSLECPHSELALIMCCVWAPYCRGSLGSHPLTLNKVSFSDKALGRRVRLKFLALSSLISLLIKGMNSRQKRLISSFKHPKEPSTAGVCLSLPHPCGGIRADCSSALSSCHGCPGLIVYNASPDILPLCIVLLSWSHLPRMLPAVIFSPGLNCWFYSSATSVQCVADPSKTKNKFTFWTPFFSLCCVLLAKEMLSRGHLLEGRVKDLSGGTLVRTSAWRGMSPLSLWAFLLPSYCQEEGISDQLLWGNFCVDLLPADIGHVCKIRDFPWRGILADGDHNLSAVSHGCTYIVLINKELHCSENLCSTNKVINHWGKYDKHP